jgi:hypothetical protein
VSGADARVLVPVPVSWQNTPLSPPDLSQAAGVRLLSWQAWGPSPTGSEVGKPESGLATACLGRDTATWARELEPIVLERLDAVVSSTALRIARVGGYRVTHLGHEAGAVMEQRLEGAGDAEHRLAARTFLGFVRGAGSSPDQLVGCFALCVDDLPACEGSVERATVEGAFVPPPPATLSVRAAVWTVHHPSVSSTLGVAFVLLAGVALLVTRRRPRTK